MPKKQPSKVTEKQKENPDNQGKSRNDKGQFLPGVSGNYLGRPPNKTPSETLRAMLIESFGGYGIEQIKLLQQTMPEPWKSRPTEELTMLEILSWVQIRAALPSDARLDRDGIWDRVEGRPILKIAGADGGPIAVDMEVNLKNLTIDELKQWRELMKKAQGSK